MADKNSALMALIAKRRAAGGISDPVANTLAGDKWGKARIDGQTVRGLPGAPLPEGYAPPRQASQGGGGSGKQAQGKQPKIDPVQEALLGRIKTGEEVGFAVPGRGMIPGAAFRPEVQEMFKGAGGVAAFDATNLSAAEQNGLRMLLDPKWVAAQNDPGAALTDEEKATALASR